MKRLFGEYTITIIAAGLKNNIFLIDGDEFIWR